MGERFGSVAALPKVRLRKPGSETSGPDEKHPHEATQHPDHIARMMELCRRFDAREVLKDNMAKLTTEDDEGPEKEQQAREALFGRQVEWKDPSVPAMPSGLTGDWFMSDEAAL